MKRIIFIFMLFSLYSHSSTAQCDPPSILWDEGGLLINWIAKDEAISHQLQYRESGTFAWTTVDIPQFQSSYSVTSLERCLEYDFRVRSICVDTESEYSGTYSMRPDCSTCFDEYCPVPNLFSNSIHITNVTLNGVSNSSTFNPDGTGYEDFRGELERIYKPGEVVEVSVDIGEQFFGVPFLAMFIDYNRNLDFDEDETVLELSFENGTNATGSFTIPDDASFGVNRLRIILSTFTEFIPACDFFGFSGEVEEYCVLIENQCDVGFETTLDMVDASGAFFSWEPLEIADAYNARYKKTSEGPEDWNELATLDPEIFIGNLDECTEYEFEVRGVCPFDTSSYKNRIIFNSFCATSTEDAELSIGTISSYPNPWSDQFVLSIESKETSTVFVEIISNTGQAVGQTKSYTIYEGKNTIALNQYASMPPGMYLIKLTNDQGEVRIHKTLKME